MVPQQVSDARSVTPTSSSGAPLFGSQLVDKNSSTPYTDATQVSASDIENIGKKIRDIVGRKKS